MYRARPRTCCENDRTDEARSLLLDELFGSFAQRLAGEDGVDRCLPTDAADSFKVGNKALRSEWIDIIAHHKQPALGQLGAPHDKAGRAAVAHYFCRSAKALGALNQQHALSAF